MRMELDNNSCSEAHDSDDQLDQLSDKNRSPSIPEPDQSDKCPLDPTCIPDSVRGAPEELKPAIRKKQNKESARRSRRRRKELVINLSQSIEMLVAKIEELEKRLDSMEKFLCRSGYEAFPQTRLCYPTLNRGMSLPGSDGGPSGSGSIPGSDGGSHSRGGSQPHTRNTGAKSTSDLDDEDVEKLIASCLGQL